MTGFTARSLLNIAYALLAERMDAADRIAVPVLLAARADPREVEDMSRRAALDRWLDAPSGPTAAAEAALLDYLRGAV